MQALNFRNVRPRWHLPPYPPYHEGLYLEEFFYKKYLQSKPLFDCYERTLIPIFWTSCYMQQIDVQPYIDALVEQLGSNTKFFVVAQHDDAIKENLPDDTLCFCAGGNNGGIPIPLICAPIPRHHTTHIRYHWEDHVRLEEKSYACSFIGSITHPIRQKLFDKLVAKPGFEFITKGWSFKIGNDQQEMFFDYTRRSMFTLCPRGYGAQSFRTYEAIQLGSIPIYVHDDNKWLPFEDKIDWESFSLVVHEDKIDQIPDMIGSISEQKYEEMRREGKAIWKHYFTLDGVANQIYNYINEDYHRK